MNELGEALAHVLRENGAVLVGYGDVSDLVDDALVTGVALAIPMPKDMIRSIEQEPTQEYRQWYNDTNAVLDRATRAAGAFLRERGYEVREHTTDKMVRSKDHRTAFPHKSVAVRAGLGWIGKSCLLVTPEYGGAVRMSTLVTNAPLPTAEPMFESKCGGCTKCRDVCPYDALKGETWEKGRDRSELFDYAKCSEGTSKRNLELLGVGMFICGKCFAFCPYTRRYIEK